MSENTPGFRPKARCFLPAWAALAALALLLSFISLYPLGEYGGSFPIRSFRDEQAKILLLVAPVGFVLIVGTAVTFLPVRAGRRFLVSLACFLGLHSTVLVRHFYFTPLYVWCSGAMPNPISLGIMLASGGAATLVSKAIDHGLEKGISPSRVAVVLLLSAMIVAFMSLYLTAPYFALQWRQAPAVLSSYYSLSAEITMPVSGAHPTTGFWFPSRQIPKYLKSTEGPLYLHSPISAGEDALFLTRGFAARLRLSGASIAWSLPYDFGWLEQDGVPYANAFAVWWQDERLYPVPVGMVLADVPSLGCWHALGPYLVEGTDGTVAVLAFFAPPGVAVTERLQDDGPPPDTGYLFGLDPETGKIAWQIRDIGDWRSPPARYGESFMVTHDVVVRWDTEPWSTLRAWETETGSLLWEHGFSPGAQFLVSPGGAVVVDGGKKATCLDVWTGAVRWEYEDASLSDLSQLFLCKGVVVTASPSVVRGCLLSDGTEVFRLDASPGTRLAAWGVHGETVVEVRSFAGSAEKVDRIFVDVRNGEAYSIEGVLGFLCVQDACTAEGFLFVAQAGSFPKPSRALNGIVPVFKAEGVLQPLRGIGEPRATHGSWGEVTLEGWVLLRSFDARIDSYRIFVLMPTIASSFRGRSPWLEPP